MAAAKSAEAAAEQALAIAKATLEKDRALFAYSRITAPFDGVVTHRSMFPGYFVRAATESGNQPLLTVQRTDKMRVVVQVPDRDVIYAYVGDPVTIEIDALPGVRYSKQISRIAQSQDPQTRLMRLEVDLPNPTGKIRDGMYGRATILLDKGADVNAKSPSGFTALSLAKEQDSVGHKRVIRKLEAAGAKK